jgi:hypothetical protein
LITGRYDNIAVITPRGYLVHSYEQVIEHNLPAAEEQPLALQLLAVEYSAFAAFKSHRWYTSLKSPLMQKPTIP